MNDAHYLVFEKAFRITNISSLPRIIPAISIRRHTTEVSGPVTPMERPTVPSDDANSNAPCNRVQPEIKEHQINVSFYHTFNAFFSG